MLNEAASGALPQETGGDTVPAVPGDQAPPAQAGQAGQNGQAGQAGQDGKDGTEADLILPIRRPHHRANRHSTEAV